MRSESHCARALLGGLGVSLLVGCGGLYDASVTGAVSLEGDLLPRGTVAFYPSQAGPTGYGLISDDGGYLIKTGREEGLPSGEYTVTVVANEPSERDPDSRLPPKPGKTITPQWYRDKKSSPLKVTVVPGSNEIDLSLTTTPPGDWVDPRQPRQRRR